jgi:hypothetical protein
MHRLDRQELIAGRRAMREECVTDHRGSASGGYVDMMRVVAAVVVLSCGCLISPVMQFGGGKSAKQAQTETMADLSANQLDVQPAWTGEVRSVKIRVWADEAYRSQHVRWQDTFGEQLAAANVVLGAKLGLELRAEYQAWERHAPGSQLAQDIEALVERDAGEDVFAVVGLTSSLSLVSATFEELGIAAVGGRHIVLRGYADLEERKAFEFSFPDLEAAERESTLEGRRRHKTTVVLLHELGHSLGAGHDSEPDTIMNASYSRLATGFTAATRTAIDEAIERRISRREVARPRAVATVVIFISEDGDIIYNGNLLRDSDLDRLFVEQRDAEIQIKHPKKAPPTTAARILDRAKKLGLTRVSVEAF